MSYRSMALMLTAYCLLGGCGKARSSPPPAPDFAGVWDVTFDDTVEVELRLGEETSRARARASDGIVAFGDAGVELSLQLACASTELVCPSEVLPRELVLEKPLGRLDPDAVQLVKSLTGIGEGDCAARAGSFLTGEVLRTEGAGDRGPEAVALTSGRVTIVVDARCAAPERSLPSGAQLFLSSGFTAAKR